MNYEILIRQDFSDLLSALEYGSDPLSARKVCIITDSNIQALYGNQLADLIRPHCRELFLQAFPAGEPNKHLDTIRDLLGGLTEQHFDRKDLILAFGGGVTGDIAGFTASVYMRGIDFVQIPTSLLAQVDSSIGGKTGVDFLGFKNLVGAFYEPKLVYMNLSLLNTLPKREYLCGLGEILKHSLLRSEDYYRWLNENREAILSRSPEIIAEMIRRSCAIKQEIVELDLKENSVRAYLNLGHTLGHAIEKESGFALSHGAAVSVGMAGAAYLSMKRGYINETVMQEILAFLDSFELPHSCPGLDEDAVFAAARSDKKIQHGTFRFVLLRCIGDVLIDNEVTEDEVRDSIRFITCSEKGEQS